MPVEPELDACDAVRDRARHELLPPTRRLVVEEEPRRSVQLVAGDPASTSAGLTLR
jgi:hypothetical protein